MRLNPESIHCWEIVASKLPLLTVHRTTWTAVVVHAEREGRAAVGAGGVVKVRRVAHCICQVVGAQPVHGETKKIMVPV